MLSDDQWAVVEPLLPRLPRRSDGRGRPWSNPRKVIEAILWMLTTGARWKDLPKDFPSKATCHRWLTWFEELGVWKDIWRGVLGALSEKQRLSLEEAFLDASFSGAKKGAKQSGSLSAERARSSWFWQAARVYLSEFRLPLRPPRKPRSPSRRSTR